MKRNAGRVTDTFRSLLDFLVGTFFSESHVHSAEYNIGGKNQSPTRVVWYLHWGVHSIFLARHDNRKAR